jgi:methylenetetrahydrofolate dehydrogenase (NADP+)/methenyltetrahydrofolate cyclohydrolase
MILMSGKELAATIKTNLAKQIRDERLKIKLAVILIGEDPASEKYVTIKEKACHEIGIDFELVKFSEETPQLDVIKVINKLNKNKKITGILVQLPMPNDFIPNEVLEAINPDKDVDGLTSTNLGRLIKDLPGLFPATPEGVMNLFKYYQIELPGKKVSVIGQSNLVGKPLAQMLLNEDATVFLANKETKNLSELTLNSDIIISAVGKPNLIKENMVNKDAIVIDVGTSLYKGKIVGDVDFDKVSKKASFITPSPGGVGPMTVAMLLSNLVKAKLLQK